MEPLQFIFIALAVAQAEPDITRHKVIEAAAARWGVDPVLALKVSHAENWTAVPTAVSRAGAVGIMQVMPIWQGSELAKACIVRSGPPWTWHADLTDVKYNGCLGVAILARYLKECRGVVRCALGRYNGATTAVGINRYIQAVERW